MDFNFGKIDNNSYRGDGAFGQFCIVIPDHMVIAITGKYKRHAKGAKHFLGRNLFKSTVT